MAIQTKITQPGNTQTSTLGGQIRIDDGNGRLVVYDGTYNRLILGTWPDGTIGLIISKPGIDVFSLFD